MQDLVAVGKCTIPSFVPPHWIYSQEKERDGRVS